MAQRKRFAPETLDVRKGAKHAHFVSSGSLPTTLDGVQVHLSKTEREHMFSVPDEDGPEFRRLRRYGLLLSRYGLVDKNGFVKRKGYGHEVVTTAERVVATEAYRSVFSGDPTVGVANVQPIITMLNSPNPSHSVICAALAYSGTQAGTAICKGITDAEFAEGLQNAMAKVREYATYYTPPIMRAINKPGRRNSNIANSNYDSLASYIDRMSSRVEVMSQERGEVGRRQAEADSVSKREGNLERRAERDMYGKRTVMKSENKVLRHILPSIDGWATALLEKMPLTLPHTGRKGRKLIPMPYGKSIRFIVREDTDPEQRVFARKTRGKGGIVVVDCSGSMSFTSEDLDLIMQSTAGATVLCYSSGNEPHDANIWQVAKGGRRTSRLPRFPGNNGVDGPALEYGVSLRRHNEPIVWISDTMVTGKGDGASDTLRDWCLDFCAKHEITIVPNARLGANVLRKIQLGQRADRTNYKKLKQESGY